MGFVLDEYTKRVCQQIKLECEREIEQIELEVKRRLKEIGDRARRSKGA